MNNRLFSKLFFSLFLFVFSLTGHAEQVAAPEFQLPGQEGTVKLSDYRGKIVYLDFWASWCGPCRQSFPWMEKMQQKYRNQGLITIAINLDKDRKLAEQFLAQFPNHFTIAFDKEGATPLSYQVKGMPSAFIINRQGFIVSQHIGFSRNKQDEYEQAILTWLNTDHGS